MAVRIERRGSLDSPLGYDGVAAALMAAAASFALAQAYQEELESTVFPARAADTAKIRRANECVLADLNTLPVLQFLWKESAFVSIGTLGVAGIARMTQGGPLTVHGLTMLLHTGESGVGSTAQRVTKIVRAARAYGLIETRALQENTVEIAGTKALHDLMLRVRIGQALKLPALPDKDDNEDDA